MNAGKSQPGGREATHSAKNATTAPAAAGAMLYHSIPIQCQPVRPLPPIVFMMKLAAVDAAHARIQNKNIRTTSWQSVRDA